MMPVHVRVVVWLIAAKLKYTPTTQDTLIRTLIYSRLSSVHTV
jgi:hypothetical protein